MPVTESSLANLKPYQKGVSGNPAGRPRAGLVVEEWIDVMANWTYDELQAATKRDQPNAKAVAARLWTHARSRRMNKGGSPIAGPEFDRLLDRSVGKPNQSVTVESKTPTGYTPEEYGRRAIEVGVQVYRLTAAQAWDRLPPEVQAVTPRPITATVTDKETT